jgi:hypothetical protein
MSLESVVINVSGSEQTFDRNKIKKIFLVERTVTHITAPEAQKANPPTVNSPPPHP